MIKNRELVIIALFVGVFSFSCSDDNDGDMDSGMTISTGNRDTTVVSGDGYTLISQDNAGDATMFIQGQVDPVPGGMDGTKLEYLFNDSTDELTFRITVEDLSSFSTSPSFDLSFQLPNGTVPAKATGLPFRGTTMTHKTVSVYTDDGGTAPSSYTFLQTNQFAVNGIGFTGEFGNPPQLNNLKTICEGCVDFRLDVPSNHIYATIDRNLIIKNEEIDSSNNSATIKIVSNVGYRRGNNDLIADGEEFTINIIREDTTSGNDTLNKLATVSTSSVDGITQTSAVIKGSVSDEGSSVVTLKGVCYSTNSNPTINDSTISSGGGIGDFTVTIQNLKEGTSYYVRAFATNSTGTSYGSELVFNTVKKDTLPTVMTAAVSFITNSSGRLNGTVVDDGNRPILERGFVVTETPNPNPDLDSNFKARAPGTGIGNFETNLTILPSNTTFYIRAFATNDLGTRFGNEVQFTTTDSTTIPTALTTIAVDIKQTSAYCGVRVIDNGNDPVIEAGLVYSTSPNPTPADNVIMVQNVGPDPAGYGIVLNGLQPGTKYYFRGYATNSFGTYFGQVLEFTTLP